jgi:hypothetical protein
MADLRFGVREKAFRVGDPLIRVLEGSAPGVEMRR